MTEVGQVKLIIVGVLKPDEPGFEEGWGIVLGPYFSIIIPVYNRALLIGRTLESCLGQDFRDFEVIVVDDGSTDGSSGFVKQYADPRIRLIRHESNRGVCPARNTAADAAGGAWVIALDSDDELLPSALAVMHRRATEAEEEISGLRFMCRLDETGELSPHPPLRDQVWDYEGYIRWWGSCYAGRQETLPCVRRETFKSVRYPEDRSLEGTYHLNFARSFRTRACTDVVRLIHSDARNRLTRPCVGWLVSSARDQANSLESVLSSHGSALEQFAPRLFLQQLLGLSTLRFLAGERRRAVRNVGRCLRRAPVSLKAWSVLALGLLSPSVLAWVKVARWRRWGGVEGALSRPDGTGCLRRATPN